ncbi:ribosomal protein S18-alanine N-acetyltransferase [Rothia mucilaginosa]|uniref:ribosomal protein S18-alanine N-acetyltransferase n=1 Tax=Rothia mucilaginosa TaxID=43675 RepID=UPI0028EB63A3|nr:ribosomal protein S18-alanine N-acetyltransferase [Rothia mucilaginosa]
MSAAENSENIVRDDLNLGARLRVAELADVQAMHRMETTLFPSDAWHIDMFLEELTHPTRTYYMLELPVENPENDEDNWRAIGYCGSMVVADTADVQTIGVLPEYEGHGYGRAMLEQMHERAREQGAERILLEVRADNPRAQRLYERNGYCAIHVRRGYYDDGTDAIIMECTF